MSSRSVSEGGSQRGGRPKTSENVEVLFIGHKPMNSFSGMWAQTLIFLGSVTHVVRIIPNNINEVFLSHSVMSDSL